METVYKQLRDDYSQKNDVLLKQTELAKLLGVSSATISRLENGTYKKTPTAEIIEAYSKFFGVTKDYLLGTVEESKELKQASALKSIGITEEVINTFSTLKRVCGNNAGGMALITEFFSHPEFVATIFSSMLSRLENKRFNEVNNYADKEIMRSFYLSQIEEYINGVIYPNISKQLDKNIRIQEANYEAIQRSYAEDCFRDR